MLYLVLLLFKFQLLLTSLHAYKVKDPEVTVNASLTNSTNGFVVSHNANNSKTPVSVPTEGGSVPITKSSSPSQKKSENDHHVSEHIVKNYSDIKKGDGRNVSVPLVDKINNPVMKINQDLGEGIPGKNDNKSVSSRKLTSSVSVANLTAAPVTKKPKKPTITEHDESYYVRQTSQSAVPEPKPKSDSPESSGVFKAPTTNERQKYLIPIVAVILSVPFVAILISLIYKKGSDWWRYRHYRRMDFLINGMYDT
ncbi:uncharacterized protein LOC108738465 [Agrilus planipennis]|uniref:Uncharacterized protein LOC108738465 n=1 Tax=Agrilus planipennis TaxID=224129 RepID=A0A1W4X3M5_AGRPL|nr:uncharacterized protein LOC108738465 [Agrilus planipennis]